MIQQAWIIDSRAHAVISEMFLQLIAVLATDGILVENMTTTILRNGNAVCQSLIVALRDFTTTTIKTLQLGKLDAANRG